jgi:hypothetical protein
LHREVLLPFVFADLVQPNDVIVFQLGRRHRLLTEPIDNAPLRLWMKRLELIAPDHFQRHDAANAALSRAIDDAHPASP